MNRRKMRLVFLLILSPTITRQMTFCALYVCLFTLCTGSTSGTLGLASELPKSTSDQGPVVIECEVEDNQCQKDKVGYDAIVSLHRLIDDDTNGYVDLQESDEFLRDELQMTNGREKSMEFHGNDKLVTVDDLWRIWRGSEVYNWTVEEVLMWLDEHVDLPQYTEVFKANHINGQDLPRLACNKSPYLSVIGINNPVHKQKLFLKAMDLVLFGVPKKVHSYIKDVFLLTLLVMAIGGLWYAYMNHRYSQQQVQKLMKDLESLQKAEEAMQKLNKTDGEELSSHHYGHVNGIRTKDPADETEEELSRFKIAEVELDQVKAALRRTEKELENQSKWSAPSQLQCWLQYTHEVEQIHFNAKRHAAELQLTSMKDMYIRMEKRNRAFLGSLRMAHSTSLDDLEQKILNAKSSIADVTNDKQERLQRWNAIEQMCGFPIMTNPGMPTLKQLLQREVNQGPFAFQAGHEDADEDLPPPYPAAGHHCLGQMGILQHKKLGGGMGSRGSLSKVGISRVNNTSTTLTPDSSSPSNGHGPVSFNLGENSTPPDLIGQMIGNYQNSANQNHHKSGHMTSMKHSQSYDLASSASESSFLNMPEKKSQSSSALKQMAITEIPESILDTSFQKKKKKSAFLKLFTGKSKVKK